MSKEKLIGVGVTGLLFLVFFGVLYWRVFRAGDAPVAKTTEPKATSPSQPPLADALREPSPNALNDSTAARNLTSRGKDDARLTVRDLDRDPSETIDTAPVRDRFAPHSDAPGRDRRFATADDESPASEPSDRVAADHREGVEDAPAGLSPAADPFRARAEPAPENPTQPSRMPARNALADGARLAPGGDRRAATAFDPSTPAGHSPVSEDASSLGSSEPRASGSQPANREFLSIYGTARESAANQPTNADAPAVGLGSPRKQLSSVDAASRDRPATLDKAANLANDPTHPAGGHRLPGEKVYVVEKGDTLFDIARFELGKAARWVDIYDLNRDLLGEAIDDLKPGTELRIPAMGNDAETITRQFHSPLKR